MNLDQKLRQLKKASKPRDPDRELEQTLEYLRRMEQPPGPRPLPAQRAAKGIEEYVEGVLAKNDLGEYFLGPAGFPFRQTLRQATHRRHLRRRPRAR